MGLQRGLGITGCALSVLMVACTSDPVEISGRVLDEQGDPIAGVEVSDGSASVTTDASGAYRLADVSDDASLTFMHCGYQPEEVALTEVTPEVEVVLEARVVGGVVRSNLTGAGVRARLLDEEGKAARSRKNGNFILQGTCAGSRVTVRSQGYEKARVTVPDEGSLQVELVAGPARTWEQIIEWQGKSKWDKLWDWVYPELKQYVSKQEMIASFVDDTASGRQITETKILDLRFTNWTFPPCTVSSFGGQTYPHTATIRNVTFYSLPGGRIEKSVGVNHLMRVKSSGKWGWVPLAGCLF